eukprot:scaffold2092_cov144-Amphora_coffeaeformis.AAC.9
MIRPSVGSSSSFPKDSVWGAGDLSKGRMRIQPTRRIQQQTIQTRSNKKKGPAAGGRLPPNENERLSQ